MTSKESFTAAVEARREVFGRPDHRLPHSDAIRDYLGAVQYAQTHPGGPRAEAGERIVDRPLPVPAVSVTAQLRAARGAFVVGVDRSSASHAALRWALDEAAVHGRRVHVVHVYEWPWPGASLGPHAEAEFDRGARLMVADALAEAAVAGTGVAVTGSAVTGEPARVLAALTATAATVVVGAPRRGELAGLVYGSVLRQLVRRAVCPIAVVHSEPANPQGAVLVGVDGSASADAAVRAALAEAAAHHCLLVAVHAGPQGRPEEEPDADGHGALTRAEHDVRTGVRRWQGEHPQVPVSYRLLRARAVDALATASGGGRLLVVGAGRGRHGLLHASVWHGVLRRADCPVLIVPAGGDPAETG